MPLYDSFTDFTSIDAMIPHHPYCYNSLYDDTLIVEDEPMHLKSYESDSEALLSKYVIKNCYLSGCGQYCARNHATKFDDELSFGLLLPADEILFSEGLEEIEPYTPNSDHCYFQMCKPYHLDVLQQQIPTPPSSSSSDDEVDVVTVPDMPPTPVPKISPRRNTRSQKNAKTAQQTVSHRALRCAMEKANITAARKQYRNRKVNGFDSCSNSSVSSDNEDNEKRANHNTSERKRRAVQKTNLQNLREQIPELKAKPRAPKVVILDAATVMVNRLKQQRDRLKLEKSSELKKKRELQNRIAMLRMQFRSKFKF